MPRERSGYSIRVKLLALMSVVALPLVVAHLLQSARQIALSRASAGDRVAQAAELMATRTDEWVGSANAVFLSLGDPVRRHWGDRATLDSTLAVASSAANQRFVNFFLVDTLGQIRGSGMPIPSSDTIRFAERDYFKAAMQSTGTVVGAPRQSFVLADRAWIVVLARALRTSDGHAYGVIASPMRVDTLTDFINIASFPERPLVTILDTSGYIVARSVAPESFVGRNIYQLGCGGEPFPDTTIVGTIVGSDEVARLTASTRSRLVPWLVNVGLPLDVFEAPLRTQLREDLMLSLLALTIAVLGAYLVGGRISGPLVLLAQDARRIADGATEHRTRVSGPREVDVLRDAVNDMADTAVRRNVALSDNERRYRFLFESNPLPMWAWNAQSLEIIAVNDAATEHYGYSRAQMLGQPITMLLDASESERFAQARLPFIEDRQHAGIWRHRTLDGVVCEMEIITTSSRRLGDESWLSIGIDVTARRAAERALAESEAQLRQSQKLEAVGAFAGGIAHDFNNLLTGIIGFCELALTEMPSNSTVRPDIVEVRSLAERGAELTRQILSVSRKQVLHPTRVDLNQMVGELERLFTRLLGEHIVVETQCGEDVGSIMADRGQLEQVLLNLVANARDAMPRGGTLTISTACLSPERAATYQLEPGTWCMLRVQDTGVGMDDDVRARIFEPFFTTKERGKGTGLGLALAYGMIEQVDGVITCVSAPDEGTTFLLFFPRLAPVDVTEVAAARSENAPAGGSETVLVAEDETSVRTIITVALRRHGYHVIAAPDGQQALALAAEYHGPIHLLLTDVVMPGMHGRELADALKIVRPDTKVLFASGYTDDAVLLRGIHVDELAFLQKPFTPSELTRRVRSVLDDTTGGTAASVSPRFR